MVSIRIRGLTKRFGDTIALSRLDLDIAAGELFFLLGPSGCGKTTLLRAIAGFHLPEEGSIYFDEEEVTQVPPHLRETAMMFQS
ncbi:MAG: ATP-binding cassette domain-containing protein, partial [Verrucomicrobiae bacterium]|nr:ATP-binding cassette domain-containing protein [Verrucomicrobiae bacterium]